MDKSFAINAVPLLLEEIRERIDQSLGIAKAACVCAESGNPAQGVRVLLGIEQMLYEATRLLDAASLINRLSRGE
jgi:hypothetical protein